MDLRTRKGVEESIEKVKNDIEILKQYKEEVFKTAPVIVLNLLDEEIINLNAMLSDLNSILEKEFTAECVVCLERVPSDKPANYIVCDDCEMKIIERREELRMDAFC